MIISFQTDSVDPEGADRSGPTLIRHLNFGNITVKEKGTQK